MNHSPCPIYVPVAFTSARRTAAATPNSSTSSSAPSGKPIHILCFMLALFCVSSLPHAFQCQAIVAVGIVCSYNCFLCRSPNRHRRGFKNTAQTVAQSAAWRHAKKATACILALHRGDGGHDSAYSRSAYQDIPCYRHGGRYFGCGRSKVIRRVVVLDFFDEHVLGTLDNSWDHSLIRVYSILPMRRQRFLS